MVFEELHDKARKFSPPDGVGVQAIVVRLVKKYAQQVTLRTPSLYSYPYGMSYPSTTGASNVTDIVNALDCCLCMDVIDGCFTIIDRVLDTALLKDDYIDKTVVPLVPELRKLAAKYQQPITSPAFAAAFQKIMVTWIDKIMGPQPADPSAKVSHLRRWTCDCTTCAGVRTFLLSKPERSQTWSRIGAPTRRHVESFLLKFAIGAATFETVRTTPQGITVCVIL